MKKINLLLVAAALLLWPWDGAFAVDGVIEINQDCAVATGCTSGGTAGFPVVISSPGSYVLTSDLEPSGAAVDVIQIDSSNVTLDLGGFSIRGGTTCTETLIPPNTVTCIVAGSAQSGIRILAAASDFHRFVRIYNGQLSGMRARAVDAAAGRNTIVEDVQVIHSGGIGIVLRRGSVARRSSVSLSGSDGLFVGVENLVESVTTRSNGGRGIFADSHSVLSRVVAIFNTVHGIDGNIGVTVLESTAKFNGGNGIEVSAGGNVSRSSAAINTLNGLSLGSNGLVEDGVYSANVQDGIQCTFGCNIRGNSVSGNAGDGIDVLGNGAADVVDNVASGNGLFGLRTNNQAVYYNRNNLDGNGTNFTDGFGLSGGANFCAGAKC